MFKTLTSKFQFSNSAFDEALNCFIERYFGPTQADGEFVLNRHNGDIKLVNANEAFDEDADGNPIYKIKPVETEEEFKEYWAIRKGLFARQYNGDDVDEYDKLGLARHFVAYHVKTNAIVGVYRNIYPEHIRELRTLRLLEKNNKLPEPFEDEGKLIEDGRYVYEFSRFGICKNKLRNAKKRGEPSPLRLMMVSQMMFANPERLEETVFGAYVTNANVVRKLENEGIASRARMGYVDSVSGKVVANIFDTESCFLNANKVSGKKRGNLRKEFMKEVHGMFGEPCADVGQDKLKYILENIDQTIEFDETGISYFNQEAGCWYKKYDSNPDGLFEQRLAPAKKVPSSIHSQKAIIKSCESAIRNAGAEPGEYVFSGSLDVWRNLKNENDGFLLKSLPNGVFMVKKEKSISQNYPKAIVEPAVIKSAECLNNIREEMVFFNEVA